MDEMKKRGATPNKSLFRRIAESEFFHNYKRSPSAIVGTVIVVLVLFIALFGPLFAPQNPYDVASLSLTDSYKPPAWEAGGDARFIFGTDSQGRDIFSSLIYGSRISLFIGVVGTLLACAVGITLGLISGYFGGRVDAVIMRLADILLSFPDIRASFIFTAGRRWYLARASTMRCSFGRPPAFSYATATPEEAAAREMPLPIFRVSTERWTSGI